jgi:hypothetical protein
LLFFLDRKKEIEEEMEFLPHMKREHATTLELDENVADAPVKKVRAHYYFYTFFLKKKLKG